MAWKKEAITDGEIDALRRVALAACNDDTRYPGWRGSSRYGGGHCYVVARWLVDRLGGRVGARRGHYVWLSPDLSYYLDLTGHHTGSVEYATNTDYRPIEALDNERTDRFTKRANRIFESLDNLVRLSLDYAGDSHPASEPQAEDNSERFNDSWTDPESYWHDEPGTPSTPEGAYQFIYANGGLEVSPNHSHAELSDHAGVNPAQHTGPFAAGHVVVTNGKATWEVQANINLHSFFRILKEATKNYGWTWGGMTDAQGQPIIEQFAPKKSTRKLAYVFSDGHLLVGRTTAADLVASSDRDLGDTAIQGTISIQGERAVVSNVHVDALPSLFEFAEDYGLTLYAGNDNVIKTIPDLQLHDTYNPQTQVSPNPHEPPPVDERLPTGLYRCPGCDRLFPNWPEYSQHRPQCAEWANRDNPEANGDNNDLPEPDHGLYGDGAHYHEFRQEPGITTGKVAGSENLPPAQASNIGFWLGWLESYAWWKNDQALIQQVGNYGRHFARYFQGQQRRMWQMGYDRARSQAFYPEVTPDINVRHNTDYWDNQTEDVDAQAQELIVWMESMIADDQLEEYQKDQPGDTTFPEEWLSHVVVLPARTWREAARVDGFEKYAKAFGYDNDEWNFYVAYRNGDPIGYAVVGHDGNVQMMHSSVENKGAATAIWHKLTKHYDSLYTHSANDKSAALLRSHGWVQSKGQLWRWAKDKAPTDLLEAPLPFIYDVQEDKIHVGHPGARTSDIPGRFTPGGIVEGNYEPGGKVVIRSLTSIPYTVRHMIELWYYTQPQLEVKSVHLQDDAGKDTRLASTDIGTTVKQYAAMDPAVQTALNTLQMAGGEVYAVGGAVRDAVMGKEPKDIDLMVRGLPKEKVSHLLESLPGRVDFTGKDFGVFRYRFKGHEVEIALPRRERSTGVGHQDFDVQADHTMKPEDDLHRRDFTANAMAVNLANGRFLDPFGGTDDIASGTLRTPNPMALAEDPLRVVRGLVANARHGLHPDEATRSQMSDNAHGLTNLPAERIQEELDKLMAADNPARAIRLAHDTGVLKYILPEVERAFGFDQRNPHHELELGDHLLNVLDRVSGKTRDPDLRLAALLHDIGKPDSAWEDPETGSYHYYEHHLPDGGVLGADHERLGAQLARERMTALKYPNERINRVTELIGHHMYPHFTTERGARRFLARVGDHANDLFTLRWGDQGGKDLYPSDPSKSLSVEQRLVDRVRNAGQATTKSQLAINGNDLIGVGIPQGPIMGQTLKYLTERVIDDPALNNPATLTQLAQEYAKIGSP